MGPADVAGWAGAATLVGAYAAVTAHVLEASSRRYQVLNAVGSVGMAVVAAGHRAWPSLTLNAVWLLIACASVAGSFARHLLGTHHATPDQELPMSHPTAGRPRPPARTLGAIRGSAGPSPEPRTRGGRSRDMNIPPILAAAASSLVLGAVVAPAFATGDESATVAYTCPAPFGDAHPAIRIVVDQPPATIVAGQAVRLGSVATFALDAATTQHARDDLGWGSLDGTITTVPTGSRVGLRLNLAGTPLAATGATNAPVSGTTLLRPTAAGPDTLRLGNLGDLVLHGLDGSGRPVSSLEFPASGGFGTCTDDATTTALTNDAGAPVVVKVVRDSTTTTTSASYSSARNRATSVVRVSSRFGLVPTGKVAFTLRKGTHVLATQRVRLDGHGVARARFASVVRAGRYSVVGVYPGSRALLGSRDAGGFSVGR